MVNIKNRIGFVLLLSAALLSGFHFYLATYHTLLIGFADIDVFLYTLLSYLRHGILYLDTEPLARTYEAGRSVLKFPPLYVVPYLPWVDATGIDPHVYKLLYALHVFRYGLAFLLCGFFLGPCKNAHWWLALFIIFALCAPFYEALYGLTFDNLFLLLLVISLVLIKFRQQWLPAVFLSYAASAKIYPVLQFIPFILARNWRMAFYCLLMMVLWLGVSIAVFGIAPQEFYFFRILPVLLHEQVLCETGNLSLAAQFCAFPVFVMLLKLFFFLATLLLVFVATKNNKPSFQHEGFLFAFVICLPLLIMQNVWGNYQLILLLPLCMLLAYVFVARGFIKHLVLASVVLAALPLTVSDNYPAMELFYYSWIGKDLPRLMIDHLKPYSALLLWFTLGFLLLRKMPETN